MAGVETSLQELPQNADSVLWKDTNFNNQLSLSDLLTLRLKERLSVMKKACSFITHGAFGLSGKGFIDSIPAPPLWTPGLCRVTHLPSWAGPDTSPPPSSPRAAGLDQQ